MAMEVVNPQPNADHASSSSSHQLQVSIDHGLTLEATAPRGQFNTMAAGARLIDSSDSDDEICSDYLFYWNNRGRQYIVGRKRIIVYEAARKGEWEKAKSVFDEYPDMIRASITGDNETALHIAAGAKNTAFVQNLVGLMNPEDMAIENKHRNTALCFAAASGVVRIAELMVEKNQHLPLIRGFDSRTPLFMAISYKRREMVAYLFPISRIKDLSFNEQFELLIAAIHSDFYDIGLKILHYSRSEIAIMKDANNETALHVMARKPLTFGREKRPSIWEKCINSCIGNKLGSYKKDETNTLFAGELMDLLWKHFLLKFPRKNLWEFVKQPQRLLHDAAKAGNTEFLRQIISTYPDIAWECDDEGKTIFHVAVQNRLENVFNLIHEIVGLKEFSSKFKSLVKGKYNILHLVAKIASPSHLNRVSGAALQMQRELIWFKEVEKVLLPSQLEAKFDDQLTPRELFTKEHKDLRKEGEEWMKNTSNSCMLVATLIATVVFAAAFTVPGGIDDHTGSPIFQRKFWFNVFVIMDAIALISSSTSILMFMSILTSRYAEDDFLHSLPSRLLFGLSSLFISIFCMVAAFSATFFMLYDRVNIPVPTTIAAMAMVPVSCFCVLQFKLWVDIFRNTYLSRFLFKGGQPKLLSTDHLVDLYCEHG